MPQVNRAYRSKCRFWTDLLRLMHLPPLIRWIWDAKKKRKISSKLYILLNKVYFILRKIQSESADKSQEESLEPTDSTKSFAHAHESLLITRMGGPKRRNTAIGLFSRQNSENCIYIGGFRKQEYWRTRKYSILTLHYCIFELFFALTRRALQTSC